MLASFARLVGVMVVLLGASACSNAGGVSEAQRAVSDFRAFYSSEDHARIYEDADPLLRQASPEGDFTRLLEAMRSRLGDVESSEQAGWHVNYGTAGQIVTLAFTTEFERGRGTETFVFRIDDETAKLAGYNIQSNELMLNEPAAKANDEPAAEQAEALN